MKSSILLLAAAFVISGNVLVAGQGRGANAGQKERDERGRAVDRAGTPATIVFSSRDAGLIRRHYASRYRNLPPGLQKKLARGGSLPPGWEKKIEPFPAVLERDLIVLPGGYKRGVMDGHAVIYNPITHAILDIVPLF